MIITPSGNAYFSTPAQVASVLVPGSPTALACAIPVDAEEDPESHERGKPSRLSRLSTREHMYVWTYLHTVYTSSMWCAGHRRTHFVWKGDKSTTRLTRTTEPRLLHCCASRRCREDSFRPTSGGCFNRGGEGCSQSDQPVLHRVYPRGWKPRCSASPPGIVCLVCAPYLDIVDLVRTCSRNGHAHGYKVLSARA